MRFGTGRERSPERNSSSGGPLLSNTQTSHIQNEILQLRSEDLSVCLIAAERLGHLKPPDALPALMATLHRANEADSVVITAICRYGVEAIEPLEAALRLPLPPIQIGAARALRRLKVRGSVPALIATLAHANQELAEILLKEVLPALCASVPFAVVDGLEHTNPDVQVAASCLLGRWKAIYAVPYLIRQLEHPNPLVREASLQALVAIGLGSVPGLLKALKTASAAGRIEITRTFRELGETALYVLKVLQEDDADAHSS
ncbi:MAG: HEAT repeat domain-containing protein [Polynucleobacter sp.]|nr:HEAT repeat domain-containing protein [Polynucleobacter sp.]